MFRTVLMLAALSAIASSPANAQTFGVFLDSQPGDYIGQGLEYNYTPAQTTFQLGTHHKNGVTMIVQGATPSTSWSLYFAAAGGVPLTVGAYESATRLWFTSGNGLEVSGIGRVCNELS